MVIRRPGGAAPPHGSDVGPGTGKGAGATSPHHVRSLGGGPRGPGGGTFPTLARTPEGLSAAGGGGGAGAAGGEGLGTDYGASHSRSDNVPASLRYNNPGAQWPNASSKKFGQTDEGVIGGGNKIAGFPSPVHGLASNIDLLQHSYTGMTVGAAIHKWSGGGRGSVPGFNSNQVITPEMARDPAFIKSFFHQMESAESGRPASLTDKQYNQAIAMQRAGSAAAYEQQQRQGGGVASSPGDASRHPRKLGDLHGGAGGGDYTGVGGYNFMGSDRARAMGMDVQPGQVQRFETGVPGRAATISANKYAGPDIAGFVKDLHAAGAPLTNYSGVFNMKRLGRGWSQHAYGNAIDIETGFGSGPDNSKALYEWAQAHPKEFAEIQARHHMRNLDTSSGAGMHDWGHFEWTPTGRGKAPSDIAAGSLHAGTLGAADQVRKSIDRANSSGGVAKVEGTGQLNVHVNAPAGTHVQAEGGGIFKRTLLHRQVPMEAAHPGSGVASVPGHGTAL